MNLKALSEILTKHGGCTRDGQAYLVPPTSTLTMYASMGVEPLIIDRIVRVEVEHELVIATTSRRERYVLTPDDLSVLRIASVDSGAGY